MALRIFGYKKPVSPLPDTMGLHYVQGLITPLSSRGYSMNATYFPKWRSWRHQTGCAVAFSPSAFPLNSVTVSVAFHDGHWNLAAPLGIGRSQFHIRAVSRPIPCYLPWPGMAEPVL